MKVRYMRSAWGEGSNCDGDSENEARGSVIKKLGPELLFNDCRLCPAPSKMYTRSYLYA